MKSIFCLFLFWLCSVNCLEFIDSETSEDNDGAIEQNTLDSLVNAVKADDLESLQSILESENLLSKYNKDLEILLDTAIESKNAKMMKYLISERIVSIDPQLTFASVEVGNVEALRFLLANGADPYARDYFGDTLLHKAVNYNNKELVQELTRYENLINSTNSSGLKPIDLTTGISESTAKKFMEVIKLLVEAGSIVPDQLIWTYWYFQVSNDMIKLFLTKSGKVDVRITWSDKDCRESLLMMLLMQEKLQYDMIKFLLDLGADVNIIYCSNMTALHRAAYFERENTIQIIQLLLDKGAHLNVMDDKGFTPLDFADRRGNKQVAQYLRKAGGINTQSYLFVRAVDNNDLETVVMMLKSDINHINQKLDYGETLLQVAAKRGSLDVIKYLVSEQHVDINEQDIYRYTALSRALEAGQLGSVKLLLELGADKCIRWPDKNLNVLDDGSIIIYQAAKTGSVEVLQFLMRRISVDVTNSAGETSAYVAAKKGDVRTLKLLLQLEADPYARALDESTMMHAAVKYSHLDVVRELSRYKELINATDRSNALPIDLISNKEVVMELVKAGSDIPDSCIINYFDIGDIDLVKYLVVESGKVNLRLPRDCSETLLVVLLSRDDPPYDEIKYLLDKGADVNMIYCDNITALHRAAYYAGENYKQVLKLLLDHGADINARNIYGRTPLDFAKMNVATYLKELGGVSGYDTSTSKDYTDVKPALKEELEVIQVERKEKKMNDNEVRKELPILVATAHSSNLHRGQAFSTPGPLVDD